jgi:hypothetical protein
VRQKKLSVRTTRVLRAAVAMNGAAGYAPLIAAAGGSWYYVADSMKVLEARFLVRWDSERQIVHPTKRAAELLRTAAYRGWGELNGES